MPFRGTRWETSKCLVPGTKVLKTELDERLLVKLFLTYAFLHLCRETNGNHGGDFSNDFFMVKHFLCKLTGDLSTPKKFNYILW